VLILGGGFAGLYAAMRLRDAPVRVTVVDRRNHHLFQPLLYQVATAGLSAPDIAAPLRHILRGQRNVEVRLGEVVGIDAAVHRLRLADGESIEFDTLVVASGATHAYFGHDDWAAHAPGLKTLDDALAIRRRLLVAFERAEAAADADERAATADRLTQEQAALLKATRLIPRMEIRGGAGSGKTILALTQAKDLTRGQGDRPAQRVALVCYSIGLSQYFMRQLAGVPRRHHPAFVGSFEDLANEWGIDTASHDRNDADFWERDLAARMTEIASGLPDGKKFDAVIVDEAQDFADHWWFPLMKALRDEDEGGLYVYSDENQRIFARFGQPPVPLVPLVLDHNLRNTQQIARAFGPLAPMRMHLRGGDGAEVTFVPCARDDAVGVADDQVDVLLATGWEPQHVALLTMGSRHPAQVERQEAQGHVGYWRSFWDNDDVFYGHVLGCKGLERRAVVLCVNAKNTERAREMLYVGMSRATDQLVVVGDPDFVREIGGSQVAARLGLEPR
jgi:hypothetical protein